MVNRAERAHHDCRVHRDRVPYVAGIAFTLVVGWMLTLAGVLHMVTRSAPTARRMALWQVLLGIVYGFIGYYVCLILSPALRGSLRSRLRRFCSSRP